MSSKGRRLFLYVLLVIMVITQVAFTKTEKSNTSEESVVNNTEKTDETENIVLAENGTENIVPEEKNEPVSRSAEEDTSYVVVINEQTDEETEKLLGVDMDAEESEYQNMIVSYADPYLPVRTEATRDSETVGKLYPGSYADIVERGEEWTKIKSGNVEGYIQNIYVCFDQEAEDLADQLRGTLSTAITLAEEKKQQEEQARLKAAAAANNTAAASVSASSYEVCLLAAIIDWEANAEPYEGKLAVAYVILNRINSASYGNSIQEVLSARGQFGGVTDGNGNWSSNFQNRINKYVNGTSNDCLRAAQDALAGNSNPLNAAYLYFNTRVSSYSQCQQIGSHYFYNY